MVVCIFNRFSEIYIEFERGPRVAIITSSNQRLPPKNKTQVTQQTKMVKKGI